MSLRFWITSLAFVAVFFISLLVTAPASMLGAQLQSFSGGRLSLANARGTLWNGSGILLLQHETQFVSMGNYAWNFAPAAALQGLLEFEVRQGENATPMRVRLAPFKQQVELAQWHTSLPAQVLAMLSPQLLPYRLTGEIKLSTDSLFLSPQGTQGQASVDWLQAGSALTEVYPLGDYRILLQGEGQKLRLQLSTLSGKLVLSGQGNMEPGKGLSFNGTARAAPGEKLESLTELLRHIGPETIPGVYALGLIKQ